LLGAGRLKNCSQNVCQAAWLSIGQGGTRVTGFSISEEVDTYLLTLGDLIGKEKIFAASARRLADFVDSLDAEGSGKPELTELRIVLDQLEAAIAIRKAAQDAEDPNKKNAAEQLKEELARRRAETA
jgi:hypothetical protein